MILRLASAVLWALFGRPAFAGCPPRAKLDKMDNKALYQAFRACTPELRAAARAFESAPEEDREKAALRVDKARHDLERIQNLLDKRETDWVSKDHGAKAKPVDPQVSAAMRDVLWDEKLSPVLSQAARIAEASRPLPPVFQTLMDRAIKPGAGGLLEEFLADQQTASEDASGGAEATPKTAEQLVEIDQIAGGRRADKASAQEKASEGQPSLESEPTHVAQHSGPARDADVVASEMSPQLREEVGDSAAGSARRLEVAGSQDESAFRGLGTVLNAVNRPAAALRSLDAAIKLNPEDAQALSQRARAKLILGDEEGARADAKRTLELSPKDALAQIIVGHADTLRGPNIGARLLDSLRKGRETKEGSAASPASPSRPAASGLPVVGSGYLGTPALAGAGVRDIRVAQNSPAAPFIEKALAKLRVGDYMGALLEATTAVDSDRKNPAAWRLRAEIDNQLGNYKGAVKDAAEALKLNPNDAQALRAKAYAEIQDGNFGQALADLARAIELEPANGVGYLYRAIAEEKMGKTAEALVDYEKAASLDASLTPLTAEAVKRLQAGAASSGTDWQAVLRKAGPAGGLALVLFALAALAAKSLFGARASATAAAASEEATVLDAGSPAAIGAGTVLGGNFRVTGELGRGGMGVVYAAFDETLQRRVAIKQLQRGERATNADLERFLKEARLVAQLKHPHLAEIYTVVNEGDLFLVFEFVDGQPLDRLLAGGRRLPLDQAQKLVADVTAALDYAHGRQIIHRDLKPSNIMLAKDGSAKIMDFGIAHQSSGAAAATKTSASGTPPYMAPEQALGSVSKASDIYALAVMTYEMVVGCRPFQGPDFLEPKLRREFPSPTSKDPSLPKALDAFFSAALDPDPTKRPASGDAFLREFHRSCRASLTA